MRRKPPRGCIRCLVPFHGRERRIEREVPSRLCATRQTRPKRHPLNLGLNTFAIDYQLSTTNYQLPTLNSQ
ncbi:hypothetical protein [Chamaesiphon polymorphus]|uniref:hypothetical protein n=1 Tax=Chamaesiphon polymorphus TaxID=2107691 RepID=UPI0011B29043|nr:hypothetical protein [Chamaesiphon polymorphus]